MWVLGWPGAMDFLRAVRSSYPLWLLGGVVGFSAMCPVGGHASTLALRAHFCELKLAGAGDLPGFRVTGTAPSVDRETFALSM